jgi:hypothetical protein
MNSDHLEDVNVSVKLVLSALWAAHFLLWTFGDMVALLQEATEPIDNELLLFVAVPLAVIQTSMILFSLVGKPKVMRWANIIAGLVFILFNLGYLTEANVGWKFLLGIAYLLVTVLIIFYAWKWPKHEGVEVTP